MEEAVKKTCMPAVAGIFTIFNGCLILIILVLFVIGSIVIRVAEAGIFDLNLPLLFMSLPAFVIAALAIVGGAFAIKRKKWPWALAGSISAALVPIPLGIVAIILLVLSRNEFKQVYP